MRGLKKLGALLILAIAGFGGYALVQQLQGEIDIIDLTPEVTTEVVTTVETTEDATDETAPVIAAVDGAVLSYTVDSSEPDYTTLVTANDDVDGDITITSAMVDSTAVDMSVAGSYDVVYTVTDVAGNTATLTISITVTTLAE